jgi:hypothetical protein
VSFSALIVCILFNWLLINLSGWWWYEKGSGDGFDRGYKKGQEDLAEQLHNQQSGGDLKWH